MTFKEALTSVFSKYATFEGRARRSEYWYFCLFNVLIGGALGFLSESYSFFGILSGLFTLALLIPGLALAWRRLHDIGKSGTNYLFILIPIVGMIMLLVWFCQDSQPGTNAYGENPKEVELL